MVEAVADNGDWACSEAAAAAAAALDLSVASLRAARDPPRPFSLLAEGA